MNETQTTTKATGELSKSRFDRVDAFLLVGIGFLLYGVGMVYRPAAVILAGFLLVFCAAAVTYGRRMEAAKKQADEIKAAKMPQPRAS